MSGIARLLDRRERGYLSAVDAQGDLPTMSGIMGVFCQMASSIGSLAAMFSTFLEDARWNADRQAVEFGVEIGEYRRGSSGAVGRGPPLVARAAHSPAGASLLPTGGTGFETTSGGSCAGAG